MSGVAPTPVLRFAATGDSLPRAREDASLTVEPMGPCLVLDPAWTPTPHDREAGFVALREVAARVLAREDLFPLTTRLLDDWAEAAGIAAAMAVDGTSFWYRRRLWAWRWLYERIVWLAILDDLVASHAPAGIDRAPDREDALGDAIGLVGARDGLAISAPVGGASGGAPGDASGLRAADEDDEVTEERVDRLAHVGGRLTPRRLLGDVLRALNVRPSDRRRRRLLERRAELGRRLDALIAEGGGRLLAVVDPAAAQVVATPTGPRSIDPFLGPVLERLSGGPLDPIFAELRPDRGDAPGTNPGAANRMIPRDLVDRRLADPADLSVSRAKAAAVEGAVAQLDAPLVARGVDLGPLLRDGLRRYVRVVLPARLREVERIARLLIALRPAALLMVDEYGRTEWLAAARRTGVPAAAVQHGVVHPWHPGYQHRDRPATRPVPDRTYLFGDYERRLLIQYGGYRADELVVAGSPRLDLAGVAPAGDRDALRAELGVAAGERLLVLSTTFADAYRRFATPVALAELFARPLPGVRIVIKLHPGEADGDMYLRLLDGITDGTAGRHDVTVVKRIDLYRLLTAADAHLGLYSTVLTEAVAVGTPNLIASMTASADLLGYVPAGVATPVGSRSELEDAMVDPPRPDPARRAAFLEDHFLPGPAAPRIAEDLVAWLVAGTPAEPSRAVR